MAEKKDQYEAVIGLEIHIRLKTQSKMYCGSGNKDSEIPNEHICPICMGHPGTLPQLNDEAVRLGTMLALALSCEITKETKFDRKNYFYPDLPKGYQISQYDMPIATNGYYELYADDMEPKRIRIERLHLEEDAAKSRHDTEGQTLIDFNRAGAPLVELVTQPDIRSAGEAKAFVQELQQVARYIGASHADMEKGHLRCDANISLRPIGDTALYPKTEIKNMNSFRSIERALEYEIERQTALWEDHKAPEQITTRGWDDKRGITVEQRTKEEAADYRYFPEPDLPPLHRSDEEIRSLLAKLPELPYVRRIRFKDEYALSYHDAKLLTEDPAVGEFFERTMSELRAWLYSLEDEPGSDDEIWKKYRSKLGRMTFSWLTSELFGLLKKAGEDFSSVPFTAENFAELLTLVFEKRINSSAGQHILKIMYDEGGDPSLIMQDHQLEQMGDANEIDAAVEGVINKNPEVVAEYKSGKEKVLMFLVGQVMKATKGKVNPEIATELLEKKLKK
ncbi:MAG: Asp-tRNA(Asn)/Glu-tRNA(Gln) amidotransferase subunit GatB [Candidatus Kerfeldbacteria bacterium]